MYLTIPMTNLIKSTQGASDFPSVMCVKTVLGKDEATYRRPTTRRLEEVVFDVESNDGIDPVEVHDTYPLRGTYSIEEALSMKSAMQPKSNDQEIHVGEMVVEELFFMWPFADEDARRDYFEDCTTWVERYVADEVLSSIVFVGADASYCRILVSSVSSPFCQNFVLPIGEASFYRVVGAKYGIAPPQ